MKIRLLAGVLLTAGLGAVSAFAQPLCSGGGSCIAVLDTGIDPSHPDFASVQSIHFRDFTDEQNPTPRDDFGHGTAVASRAVGDGTCARGLAAGAKLLVAKVNDPENPQSIFLSQVVEAIDWAVANGADVINMSFGGLDVVGGQFGIGNEGLLLGKNEVERKITEAANAGVLSVIAVGNTIVSSSELNTPPNAVEALVVGAASADGTPKNPFPDVFLVGFAIPGRGATFFSDMDPHVTAVGSGEILLARAGGLDMGGQALPVDENGEPDSNGRCVRAAGTSFSAPFVTGEAAFLKDAYAGSDTGGDLVRYLTRLIQWTARDTLYPYAFEGFGFAEDEAAVERAESHARNGDLPATPYPNEAFRMLSDEIRRVF